MKALRKWLLSFKGALIMACLGLFNVGTSAYHSDPMLWLHVLFVVLWVVVAKRALSKQLLPGEIEVVLTQDQKDRLTEADRQLKIVMREVEAECIAEAQAKAKEEKHRQDTLRNLAVALKAKKKSNEKRKGDQDA